MAGFGSGRGNNFVDNQRAIEGLQDFAKGVLTDAYNTVAYVVDSGVDVAADVASEVSTNASNRWNDDIAPFLNSMLGNNAEQPEAKGTHRGEFQIPQGSETMGLLQEMLEASGHNIGGVDKINGPMTTAAVNSAVAENDNPNSQAIAPGEPLTLNHLLDVSRAAYVADGATYNAEFRERVMDVIKNAEEYLTDPSASPVLAAEMSLTHDG